jgi:hypothetical protein
MAPMKNNELGNINEKAVTAYSKSLSQDGWCPSPRFHIDISCASATPTCLLQKHNYFRNYFYAIKMDHKNVRNLPASKIRVIKKSPFNVSI